MAFNINAHVMLSGPKNIKAVTKRIQKDLGRVNARINLVAPKNLSKKIGSFNKGLNRLTKNIKALSASATTATGHLQKLGNQLRTLSKTSTQLSKSQTSVQKSLSKTGQNVHEARNEIQAFGKDAALAIRRFAAFTVATGVVFGFVRAIQTATKAAIAYEREIVKIVQVTSASAGKIKDLSGTIQQLSVSLGVDANELAELGRIFAQTGQTIDEVGSSLRAVARSSLAPSFGAMKNTAEGLIAAMAQFNIAAHRSEEVLAGLNAVSKKWAVEAEDMISVIRRAGGVFSAAAGPMKDPVDSLNELIGIFTAVRSTTRETADTIAVGLRTIFTRIQRRGTIDFLKQFNIELVNAKGNFIGLFPAFQELSRGLGDIIKKGDALTLSAITEELGGVRQVGKLIPAIMQFNKALAATKVAGQAAKEGLGKDVALALQPLGKQFEMLQQRFNALIRDITQSKTFQNMAKVALSMANAFLSVAETLKPLIPLMVTFAAIKISRGMFDFGAGFIGGLRKGGGAGGAGGALGGVITGGGGGGKKSGGAKKSVSAQRALTAAIKSHATLLTSNNVALRQLGTQVVSNTTAINAAGSKVAMSSTQIIGAVGNLINALNRASLGGGVVTRRSKPPKFARGGYVSGPSHAQGGVPAILEGGEYVIPKTQYHAGGTTGSLGVTGMSTKEILASARKQGKEPKGVTRKTKNITLDQAIKRELPKNALNQGFGKDRVDKRLAAMSAAKKKSAPKKPKGKEDIGNSTFGTRFGVSFLRGPIPLASKYEATISQVLRKSNATGRAKLEAGIVKYVNKNKPKGRKKITNAKEAKINRGAMLKATGVKPALLQEKGRKIFNDEIRDGIPTMFEKAVAAWRNTEFDATKPAMKLKKLVSKSAIGAVEGQFFEAFVRRITKNTIKDKDSKADAIMDFTKLPGNMKDRDELFGPGKFIVPNEFKNVASSDNIASTIGKALATGKGGLIFNAANYAAKGGSIFAPKGTDTVPAMLTPGEFVVNKKSAQKIGYGTLGKMNNYAEGGVVQYLKKGGLKKKGKKKKKKDGEDGGDGPDAMGMVFGIQMAVGALAGFTVALSSFDIKKPMTSLMTLGMAAMQAAGAFVLLAPSLMKNVGAGLKMEKGMKSVKGQFSGVTKPLSRMQLSITKVADAQKMQAAKARALIKAEKATTLKAQKLRLAADLKSGKITGPGKLEGRRWTPTPLTKEGLPSMGRKEGKAWMKKNLVSEPLSPEAKARVRAGVGGPKITMAKTLGTTLKTNIPKVLKGAFRGFPGLIASLIVGPIVGVIGNAVAKSIFGRKQQIKGTNIEGRARGSGHMAGALEASGGAAGAAIALAAVAALVPGLNLWIAALAVGVVAAKLFEGAMVGAAKQAEFVAFKEMAKSVKDTTETLKRFNAAEIIGIASVQHLNNALAKTAGKFDSISKAAFEREKQEMTGGPQGAGRFVSRGLQGAGAGVVTGLAISGIAAVAVQFGILAGTLGMVATPLGAVIAGVIGFTIGLGVGLVSAIFTAGKRVKALAKSFDKAAMSITPEFMEELDKAFGRTSSAVIDHLAVMDEGVLKELAKVETVNPEADQATRQTEAVSGYQAMNTALDSATGSVGAFIDELNILTAMKVKFEFIKIIQDEASLLDEKGANALKAAFQGVRGGLEKALQAAMKAGGDLDEVFSIIGSMDIDATAKQELKDRAIGILQEATESKKAIAVQKMAEMASLRSRRALDALAAGLDQFANKMSAVTNRFSNLTSMVQDEFSQITGERSVGKLNQINPFSEENLSNASDTDIDAAINQLKALGGGEESDVAFREMGDLVKGQRDFPAAMRKIGAQLTQDAAKAPSGGLENKTVQDSIIDGLEDAGIRFGVVAEKAFREKIDSLSTANRQEGEEGKLILSGPKLEGILSEHGEITEMLSGVQKKAISELEGMTDSLMKFKGSLLDVARVQSQMAKHRVTSEMAILDKQKSIRDRANNALKKSPDAVAQAMDDLRDRMVLLTTGGLEDSKRSGTPVRGKIKSGMDMFNFGDDAVNPLFTKLKTLESKRAELRTRIEPTGAEAAAMSDDALKKAMVEFENNTSELSNLTREIVGTEDAIRILANDTRVLAAIESEISKQQSTAKQSEQSFMGLLGGIDKLRKGEMSRQDFKGQFVDVISLINKSFAKDGPDVDFSEAVRLLQLMSSGDPLAAGLIGEKIDQLVAQEEAVGGGRSREDLIDEFMANLREKTGEHAEGVLAGLDVTGVFDPLMAQLSRSVKATDKAKDLATTLQVVGDRQVDALKKMLAHEQSQMATVLTDAHHGFKLAIVDFHNAVKEFAVFRGGIQGADITSLESNLNEAIGEARKTGVSLGEVKDRHPSGEAAVEKFKAEQAGLPEADRLQGAELAEEIVRVKNAGIEAERAANAIVIKDLESQLAVDAERVLKAEKLLELAKLTKAAQDAEKARSAEEAEREDRERAEEARRRNELTAEEVAGLTTTQEGLRAAVEPLGPTTTTVPAEPPGSATEAALAAARGESTTGAREVTTQGNSWDRLSAQLESLDPTGQLVSGLQQAFPNWTVGGERELHDVSVRDRGAQDALFDAIAVKALGKEDAGGGANLVTKESEALAKDLKILRNHMVKLSQDVDAGVLSQTTIDAGYEDAYHKMRKQSWAGVEGSAVGEATGGMDWSALIDEHIADAISSRSLSAVDPPGLQVGGEVTRSGSIAMHAGEVVLSSPQVKKMLKYQQDLLAITKKSHSVLKNIFNAIRNQSPLLQAIAAAGGAGGAKPDAVKLGAGGAGAARGGAGAGGAKPAGAAGGAADVAREGDAEARVASEKPGGLGEGGKRHKPLTKKQKAAQTKTREGELEQAREKDEAATSEFDQNMESQQKEIDTHRAEAEEWLNFSKQEQEQATEGKYSVGGGFYVEGASPEKAKEYQANIDQNEKSRQERVDYWNEQQKKLDKTKERGAHAPETQKTKERHSQEDKLQRENVERQEKWDEMTPEERDKSHSRRDIIMDREPGTSKAAFEARQPVDPKMDGDAAQAADTKKTQPTTTKKPKPKTTRQQNMANRGQADIDKRASRVSERKAEEERQAALDETDPLGLKHGGPDSVFAMEEREKANEKRISQAKATDKKMGWGPKREAQARAGIEKDKKKREKSQALSHEISGKRSDEQAAAKTKMDQFTTDVIKPKRAAEKRASDEANTKIAQLRDQKTTRQTRLEEERVEADPAVKAQYDKLLAEQQAADKAKSAIPDPLDAEGNFVFREPALSDIPQDLPPDRPPGPRSGLVNPPKSKPPEPSPPVSPDYRNMTDTELAQHRTGFVGMDYKPTPGAGPLPFGQLPEQAAAANRKAEADYHEAGRVARVAEDKPIAAKPSIREDTGPIHRQGEGVTTPGVRRAVATEMTPRSEMPTVSPPSVQNAGTVFREGQGVTTPRATLEPTASPQFGGNWSVPSEKISADQIARMDQQSTDRGRQQASSNLSELERPSVGGRATAARGGAAGGGAGGQAGVAGGKVVLEGGEKTGNDLAEGMAKGAELFAEKAVTAIGNASVDWSGRLEPIRVIMSVAGGLTAGLDTEKFYDAIRTAVNEVANSSDGSSKGDMASKPKTNPASNPTSNNGL